MMNISNKYDVLIFDLDDTLIDNYENVKYAFKIVCNYLNEEFTEELFNKWYLFDKEYWVKYDNNLLELSLDRNDKNFIPYVRGLRFNLFFNNKYSIDKCIEINDIFLNSLKEKIIPINNAKEVLEYLNNKYILVIGTNGPSIAASTKLEKIGCLNLFKYIFSADMTKNIVTKPSKEYIDELLEYIDYYDKDKILIIGDTIRIDVMCGINSNIDTCWFNKLNEELDNNYKPTYIINDLIELKNIL